MPSVALIIPAAGSGRRLKQKTAKPFIRIGSKSILEHTVERFLKIRELQQIIIAASPSYETAVSEILNRITTGINVQLVEGGKERQHSIHNALKRVGDVDLVAVHDAVRPFVQQKQVEKCCQAAFKHGGAVLGIPAKDTIKRVDDDRIIQETPDRRFLWQTQTPQVFQKQIIIEAYEQALNDNFVGTDDASLVERLGETVKMVEGDYTNFKITFPLDLELSKILIDSKK